MSLENKNVQNLTSKGNPLLKKRLVKESEPVITSRSLDEYQDIFGVDFKKMKGELVLDIGSGRGSFWKEATDLGLKVISLNPAFSKLNSSSYYSLKQIAHPEGDVSARAQEMPFADNSFNFEFALYSVPTYLPQVAKEYENTINEIYRTLKPGGKAYIYPVALKQFNDFLKQQFIDKKVLFSYSFDEDRFILVLTKK